MSMIGGVTSSPTHAIRQAAPPPPPPKADNDGDEGTESATAKAAESSTPRALNATA